MVLGEFKHKSKSAQLRIAPISERFLAFFFDIVLFTPLFTVLLSQIFKKIELRYYLAPDSIEFVALAIIAVFLIAVLTILFQSLFIHYFQGTPGKLVFKLRVVDSSTGLHPSLGNSFLRSTLWVIEFFLLGIPLLEIMSQKQRRALHDRASETAVITLKEIADPGPHPLESHFVRNLLMIFVTVFCVWGALVASKLYVAAVRGDFKKQELVNDKYLCNAVTESVEPGQSRLDYAIALFVAQQIPDDCLLSEADFAFWTNNEFELSWAYLAKSFYYKFDSDKSESYLEKVCEFDKNSTACEIAKVIQDGGEFKKASKAAETLTAQILNLKEMLSSSAEQAILSAMNG
jgi:uncharacterized RDD family membrane protein YckC